MTEQKPSSPSPSPATPPAPENPTRAPQPQFHIYSRQKDQHVVGPGCWCMPKTEIVEGRKIVIHKRD